MKKIFATLMIILATAGFVSCGDDPDDNPITGLSAEIENTSWEGTYVAYINSPYSGQTPMYLNWTLDFNEGGEGIIMLEVESDAVESVTTEGAMTYTYDNNNHGHMSYEIMETSCESDFQIDAINRTMTTTLTFDANHEEGGPSYTYGGQITLRQTR